MSREVFNELDDDVEEQLDDKLLVESFNSDLFEEETATLIDPQ